MKKTMCMTAALLLWAGTALAQDKAATGAAPEAAAPATATATATAEAGAKAATTVNVKVVLTMSLEDLTALAELPQNVQEAVKAGSSEEEVGKTLKELKENKVKGKDAVEVSKHFKKEAEAGNSDKGMSDSVHACMLLGKKGQDLVSCFKEDWEKKPKVKKEAGAMPAEGCQCKGQGGPDCKCGEPGHECKGGPDGKPCPGCMGKPGEPGHECKGGPDGKPCGCMGKPGEEGMGAPEGKGKPEDVGKGAPEGKGKPEDVGKAKPVEKVEKAVKADKADKGKEAK